MFASLALAAMVFIAEPLTKVEATPQRVRIAIADASLANLKPDERDAKLTVSVASADARDDRPIMGSWKIEKNDCVFTPRFPFEAGLKYRVRIDKHELMFELPGAKSVPSQVTAIYPSSEKLPENLLRLYIHFDRPMKPGYAFDNLKLLDAQGKVVERPFLVMDEELWSPDMMRFTLLLDPGRVKQELKPREELGPVLVAGRKYTLMVGKEWKTADGATLKREFRKEFVAGPASEASLDAKKWTVIAPEANSSKPLTIQFDRSLDRALLERVIRVENAKGEEVVGTISIEADETRWLFVPAQPWKPGKHAIAVRDVLEDVCGNRMGRAFEVRLAREKDDAVDSSRLEFDVK